MLAAFIRFIKRFLVLVPGLLISVLVIRGVFPVIERRLPVALAVLVTYILIAYLLIPASMRLLRWFVRPKHFPLYSLTPDGFACDPLNIGLVGTRAQLIRAMRQAGWFKADPLTPRTLAKMSLSLLLDQPYPTAPFSALYLFGRKHDIGFELPLADNASARHHVRFWAASHTFDPRHWEHISFWDRIQHSNLAGGQILWLGAATRDIGIRPIRHNAQLTHMIDPDTNAERRFLVRQLKGTGLVKSTRSVKVGRSYQLRNRVLTGYLKADGHITICEL